MSPYGAASVLIAISEGVTGSGNEEIYRTLRLPQDKSVVRIGLRDVHRHLKVRRLKQSSSLKIFFYFSIDHCFSFRVTSYLKKDFWPV